MHKHTNIYTKTVYKHMISDTKQNTQIFCKLEILLKNIFFLNSVHVFSHIFIFTYYLFISLHYKFIADYILHSIMQMNGLYYLMKKNLFYSRSLMQEKIDVERQTKYKIVVDKMKFIVAKYDQIPLISTLGIAEFPPDSLIPK